MYLIWYCLFCINIAFVMAAIFKKKFEESIATVQLGIIVLLYFFYVLDFLAIGFWIICLLFTLTTVYAAIKIIKSHRLNNALRLVFRPSAVIYVLLLSLVYLTVRGNTVKLIDELHLWAALPKILFYHGGKLQLKESMLLGYQHYIPGVSLYLYFLERINVVFSEPLLYFGYASLGAAMLLPMSGKVLSFRKWYFIPIITMVLYWVPLVFYNAVYNDLTIYYKSIHVDPILGITVGYGTWLLAQKPWSSIFNVIRFSLCCSFVVLIKSSGIAFVVIWLLSTILYLFIYERDMLKKQYIWIGVALPLAIYLIWKGCLDFYDVTDMFNYSVADILNVSFMKEFVLALMSQVILYPGSGKYSAYCTFTSIVSWLLILFLTWWFIIRGRIEEKGRMLKWVLTTLIIQIIVFVIGLYGLCVGPLFDSSLPSYPRYICTTLTAFLSFFVLNFSYEVDIFISGITKTGKKALSVLFIFEFLFGLCFSPFYLPSKINPDIGVIDADEIELIVCRYPVLEGEKNGNKVALIVDGTYTAWWYLCRRLYFNLIDEGFILNNVYFEDDIVNEASKDNGKTLTISEGKGWDNYKYIYWVHGVPDSLKELETFRVVAINGRDISLQKIEQQNIK